MSDPDPITRLNAALEGRYRIESELGEGGIANVYLADDIKHERKVALRVLKPELAAVVGAERFLAGVKRAANLTLDPAPSGKLYSAVTKYWPRIAVGLVTSVGVAG
jgi:serine/threonine protein kinase